MKIIFIPVCYNAEVDALKLLSSIERSLSFLCEGANLELNVVLADNSTVECQRLKNFQSNFFFYDYFKFDNVGYFPAFYESFFRVVSNKSMIYDYVVVCNVDLVVSDSFFSEILTLSVDSNCGVIAPAIISKESDEDINPKIQCRVNRSKLIKLKTLFSYPFLFKIYRALSLRRSRKKIRPVTMGARFIYAPHGSFIVFTKNYLLSGASLHYPRFLFGEELFVAEETLKHGLKVIHRKELVIYDDEHGSTSKINSSFLSKEHVKSYIYLLENYFNG